MDNINYNPNDGDKISPDPSGNVLKSARNQGGHPSPAAILRQLSTHVDNSSNLARLRQWSGIGLACLAVLLVIVRWSQQEKLIQSHKDR